MRMLVNHPAELSPEEAFVLACAGGCSEPRPRDFNWDRASELAAEHRVMSLLSDFATHDEQLRNRARWSLLLSAELLRVLDVLERDGIPAIPFKGPILAQTLYGDPAIRESCDLDLLVRADDIGRVPATLAGAGYATDLPTGARARDAYIRARYELHFTSPIQDIPVEVHQAFVARSYCLDLDYEGIWRRAEFTCFFGRDVRTLAPADLLLMLCIHGAKHEWNELIHIADIARVLRNSEQRFRLPDLSGCGAERIVRIGLLLAARVLHAPVPAAVLKACEKDRVACKLANEARQRLFQDKNEGSLLRSHRWFLRSRERHRDQLKMCASLICSPTETDYAALALPKFLSPLYFPLHALRMVAKHTRAALRTASNQVS